MSEKTVKRKLPASFSKQTMAAAQQTAVPALTLPVGCITYVAAQEDVEQVCQSILASGVEALGFDVEWHVTYRTGEEPRPVAVIQLAMPTSPKAVRCYLLHIACSGITQSLSRILCGPDIRKAGVGISGDAQKLMRDFGLHCEGLVDLSEEADLRLCHPSSGRLPQKWSLARLAECTLRRSIEKDQMLRTGNWATWPLSAQQQQYAARDAYASLLIYQHLMALPVPVLKAAPPLAEVPDQASEQASEPLHVSALSSIAPLQPAKLAVWKLFMEQGMAVEAIAMLRHVKVDTVESYLADAMTAGKAYDWHRLHVPEETLAAVSTHASAQLAAAAASVMNGTGTGTRPQQRPEDSPALPQSPRIDGLNSESADGHSYLDVCCAQRVPDDCEWEDQSILSLKAQGHESESWGVAPMSGGADAQHWHSECSGVHSARRHPSNSAPPAADAADVSGLGCERLPHADMAPSVPSIGLSIAQLISSPVLPSKGPRCHLEPSGADCRDASGVWQIPDDSRAGAMRWGDRRLEQGVDLLSSLQEVGVTIKVLKEQLPEGIRFGQIRLCLAHAGRCSWL